MMTCSRAASRTMCEPGSYTELFTGSCKMGGGHIRHQTHSSSILAVATMLGLGTATLLILYYEFNHKPLQFYIVIALYGVLTLVVWIYSLKRKVFVLK